MEKLITRKEAAKILGISIATLDAARNNGLISYVQYVQNGCVYFTDMAFRSISQNAHTGQNLWKRAQLTASPGTPKHEPIRILAGIEEV